MSHHSPAPVFEWPTIFAHPRVLLDTETDDQTYLELIQKDGAIYEDSDEESSDDESNVDSGDEEDIPEDQEPPHPVKLFMQPAIHGEGMGKQRLDENIVYEFCEHAAEQDQPDDFIAIVDIRSNEKAKADGEFPMPPMEPMASSEQEEGEGPNISADRILVSLPNMGEPGMRVLAECAPSRERGSLARFFYSNLQFTPSVDVALATIGFPTYAFHLNVPFVAFRRHRSLRTDNRQKPGGQSLRRSWTAACLATQSSDNGKPQRLPCFYEVQASIMLAGIDDCVYKVYGTVDNYYLPKSKSKDSVEAYHRDWEESGRTQMWDPFSRRSRVVDHPIWESRHYFLSIWFGYLDQASREWELITTVMKDAVKQRRMATPRTAKDVQELEAWTEEMVRLLKQLIEPLSEMTKVWEEFKKCDLGYFISDDNKERIYLRQQLEKSYSLLRLKLDTLTDLRQELMDTNRHELGVIGFCLSAVTQVTGIFNMQEGVLPFKATTHTFGLCLFGFVLFYLVVCFNVTCPLSKFSRFLFDGVHGGQVLKTPTKPGKPAATPPSVEGADGIEFAERRSFHVTSRRPRTSVEDLESGIST
ncbi:hypothetical protein QBC34DRAFT_385803 [Podospora aff. communis PSN243]|uniref:Uncharacterized protein n=1 Tax=Podospora aff. communis PSN243 TaxID=3040156 RepID=A0AAV9G6Q8_9PEZI|nr:hypothetical protein QBC34DRAFT_385803 [Podospora aff. communis PSN243]